MVERGIENARRFVGVRFGDDPAVRALREAAGAHAAVLYPAPHARPAEALAGHVGPLTLWVLDGTWWQAHKLWQQNPWLHALPAYRLTPSAPSRYRIRAEPAAHCLSTVEALAELLDALEGETGRHGALLAPFDAMVEAQLTFGARGAGRHASRPRVRPPPRLPEPLASRPGDALLVHGEGSGWPARERSGPPCELFQWLALRPATGESFHAFVRPEHGLSPKALGHQALDPGMLASAVGRDELAERWSAFVRADDIWCSYGYFTLGLSARAGLAPPRAVDLREVVGRVEKVRLGKLEQVVERLSLRAPAPLHPGRGGRRLAMMTALLERLRARTA
jgi:hypothetical protein